MFLTKDGGLQCGDERSSCTHRGLFSKKMTRVLHPLQIALKFRLFAKQFFISINVLIFNSDYLINQSTQNQL